MKKLLTAAILFCAVWALCIGAEHIWEHLNVTDTTPEVEHTVYFIAGRYDDLQGQVLTNDGNVWDYTQDIISDEPSYNNEPIIACIDDNGTPTEVTDDIILGLVIDRETAIYDELEEALSIKFDLEREGNNIRIQGLADVE